MTVDDDVVLRVRELRGRFDGQEHDTLHDVGFDVRSGRITAIVGETGSGKSLTGLCALGIQPSSFRVLQGSIDFMGVELLGAPGSVMRSIRGRRIAMVFQDARTALNPVFTVGAQLAEAYRAHTGASPREAAAEAVSALERVRINDPARRAKQYPHEFSGGMAQRVMIAMGLICAPELVILDEPTTGLDVTIQAGIMDLLAELAEGGMTAILITHDLGVVAETCDDVVVMREGRVVETGSAKQIFTAARDEYTIALLEASRAIEDVVA